MRIRIALIVLIFFYGCGASIPPMPAYTTFEGKTCAENCQDKYEGCMKNEIRPHYLIFSPRKQACDKMLKECYENCSEEEKQ